jgi:beta-galactosidase
MAHFATGHSFSMKNSIRLLSTFVFLVLFGVSLRTFAVPASNTAPHTFRLENGKFTLDGKPFQIISGEMHSPRIPRAYWRARLRMAKAMGLNTVTAYAFWNEHEEQPGVFDFTGQHDVAEFIREAQSEGLYVILRPGPYVCAEWEWGGYPAWLLKQHDIVVRSSDPKYMEPARRWLMRLGKELAPLQVGNGGPIVAVQVENEYGSFGNDHSYMEQIHRALVDAGFDKALLYTADGPEEVPDGSLPELPAVINFGRGGAKDGFALLHKLRPEGPFMSGEYWAGWFDHWGEKHHTTNAKQQREEADELGWMLSQGYSVSIYMFNGGTNFGWMNGANIEGKKYQPTVTSYDYDAPLDESGRPTPKYALYRETIEKATGITPPPVPPVEPTIAVPAFHLDASASLWHTLPRPIESVQVQSMEDLGQAYGYILYRTTVTKPTRGELVLDQLHDYAKIYANSVLIGTLDRRLEQDRLGVDLKEPNTRLDILVENGGRINFTQAMRYERKGITEQVTLAGKPLTGWKIYPLPMKDPGKLGFSDAACSGPCFYRGTFNLNKTGDTFLDTDQFTKGFVWVNGHELGRFWEIGPQKALYLPGVWLRTGKNEVIIFDLEGASGRTAEGKASPVLDGPAGRQPR